MDIHLPVDPAQVAGRIAQITDEEIKHYHDLHEHESAKDGQDVITEADTAIEQRLKSLLLELLPGSAIVGEEGTKAGDAGSEYHWVLDPIDGTINFARGYEFFTTVACLQDESGPLLAIVYQPSQNTVTVAVRGQACRQWRLDDAGHANTLHTGDNSWNRSVHSLMLTPKLAAKSRASTMQLIDLLLNETLGVRILVSQAYEAVKLAEGGISAVISLQSSGGWSRDAARLICESAGGRYATLVSTEDASTKGFMLVDTAQNFAKLAETVQSVGYHIEK